MKTKTPRYGIFYKSHGTWTGPYANYVDTFKKVTSLDIPSLKKSLKSKISIRQVKSV